MAHAQAAGARRSAYRSALASRDFRLLMTSETISNTGTWAYNVALAVYLYQRTHSAGWVALASMVRFLPSIVVSPYAGVIADRVERVQLMFRLNLLLLGLQAALAALVAADGPLWLLLVLVMSSSVTASPYIPSVAAIVPQTVSEDDLVAANALNASSDNLVVFLGPAVSAVLLMVSGPTLAIAANAGTFAVAAFIVSRLHVRSVPADVSDGGTRGPVHQALDGFRAIASSSRVTVLVAFSVIATVVYGTDTVLFAPLAQHQFHLGGRGYGYLLAGLGVGGLLGAPLITKVAVRPRLGVIILVSLSMYCLPVAAMVWVHQGAVAIALEVVRGAATLVVDALAITALQRSLPSDMTARVFGAFFALVPAACAVGALVMPPLLSSIGLHATLLVVGLGIPALLLTSLPRLLAMDRVAVERVRELAPRIALFEEAELFAAATRASLERLAAVAVPVRFGPRQVVIREGGQSDALYLVARGVVRVTATGPDGWSQRSLATLSAGRYFGEVGILGGRPRNATVTALTECELLRVSAEDFLQAVTDLSASPSLLEGAMHRQVTPPAASRPREVVLPEQTGPDFDGLTVVLPDAPGVTATTD